MSAPDQVQAYLERIAKKKVKAPKEKTRTRGAALHTRFCPYCPIESNIFLTRHKNQVSCNEHRAEHRRDMDAKYARERYATDPEYRDKIIAEIKARYQRDREKILARRRERYASDPEYREKSIEQRFRCLTGLRCPEQLSSGLRLFPVYQN